MTIGLTKSPEVSVQNVRPVGLEREADSAAPGPVLLFDGVCNLCNSAVQFVLERDRQQAFRFASLQSRAARDLLAEQNVTAGDLPDSMVLIDASGVHIRSDAALRVARHLGWPYSWLGAGRIVPRAVRDGIYAWIARNRYRWFGKRDVCRLATPAERDRFLDSAEPVRPVGDVATQAP
jgi:predicted DCC family thiol-disulfide oxidoreductase YuxK